jgi:hypothetical protein
MSSWVTREVNYQRIYRSKIHHQWCLYQWTLRLNHHQEMVRALTVYTARFTILSHCYIQMIKVGQDRGTFTFWILPKQQQNGVEKLSTKGIWTK